MSDPSPKEDTPNPEALQEVFEAADEQQIVDLVESISNQGVLRQVSLMKPIERDQLISLLSPESAAELVQDAPAELAVALIQDLDSSVAASAIHKPVFLKIRNDLIPAEVSNTLPIKRLQRQISHLIH